MSQPTRENQKNEDEKSNVCEGASMSNKKKLKRRMAKSKVKKAEEVEKQRNAEQLRSEHSFNLFLF